MESISENPDDTIVNLDLIFGHIEIRDIPPRIEGNDLIPRCRHICYDRHGKITKDEIFETGLRLINGACYAYMFGGRP